ncbi:Neurexin-3-beta [Anas platyrhynchos]|uniref:Neurexin-3-beta n=1 Tax=Anas platyrhynchos TaxID=8839 RepID=R0K5R9_ANAPL|nr:Neurexin-3-beta [Anas platyrhynchos]
MNEKKGVAPCKQGNTDSERFQMVKQKIPFKYNRPVEEWLQEKGRQLTIFNTQAQIAIGGKDRGRLFQGQLSGLYYNGLKVLNMAAENNPNIKINGSVRLVGEVPSILGTTPTTSVPPEMSTTVMETTTTMATTTTRKNRSPPSIQDLKKADFKNELHPKAEVFSKPTTDSGVKQYRGNMVETGSSTDPQPGRIDPSFVKCGTVVPFTCTGIRILSAIFFRCSYESFFPTVTSLKIRVEVQLKAELRKCEVKAIIECDNEVSPFQCKTTAILYHCKWAVGLKAVFLVSEVAELTDNYHF